MARATMSERMDALCLLLEEHQDAVSVGYARQVDQMVGIEGRLKYWIKALGKLANNLAHHHERLVAVETRLDNEEGVEEVMNEQALRQRVDMLGEKNMALIHDNDKLRLELQRWEQMDTRICRKYGVNSAGRVYNRQSGVEIPENEPLILFRAKDKHLPAILNFYRSLCEDAAHCALVMENIRDVKTWQLIHMGDVHEPDTDTSSYGGPAQAVPDDENRGRDFDSTAYALGVLRMNGELGSVDVCLTGNGMSYCHKDVVEVIKTLDGGLEIQRADGKMDEYAPGQWGGFKWVT